jgi:hypothetical protein
MAIFNRTSKVIMDTYINDNKIVFTQMFYINATIGLVLVVD